MSTKTILDERFQHPTLARPLHWLNPPPTWRLSSSGLVMCPAAKTDFWQKTHYGFRADTGHFLYLEIKGDFEMTTQVNFRPVHQYDQAGLMVRVSPGCWLKTSVEYEAQGPAKIGAVVTNGGQSDWSLQDFPRTRRRVALRIRRTARDFLVERKRPGRKDWELIRVAHLRDAGKQPIQCGLYACSPKGAGYQATFEYLQVVTCTANKPN